MEVRKRVVLAFVLIVSFSVPVEAQTTFTIFPGTRFCTEEIPHTEILTTTVTLTAGTVNHFLTSRTSSGWFGRPDPVMMLVSPTGTIVAFNDDFVGLDSDILFTPTTTGPFRLIVHSFSTPAAGFTNVLFSVGGAAPTSLATAHRFGGTTLSPIGPPAQDLLPMGRAETQCSWCFRGVASVRKPYSMTMLEVPRDPSHSRQVWV